MPAIEIRPAIKNDLDAMLSLEHSVQTTRAWQMERTVEDGQFSVKFREVNLPRALRLAYPRKPENLRLEWGDRAAILVACANGGVVGYLDLIHLPATQLAWISDIVVKENLRRQGIGSALLMAAHDWSIKRGFSHLMLEMMLKNYPGTCLALKFGFEFCGFNDCQYSTQDIALFFQRSLR